MNPPLRPSPSRSVFLAVLRQPNYAKLLTGQVIAAFGDRINQAALLSFIVYVTGDTAKSSADILFWWVLPSVALGLFAVALIDRWDRQRTMVVSDCVRAGLVVCLPMLMGCVRHPYVIFAIIFLIGTFSALFAPCRLAIMPNLISRELLMPANALSSQAGTVATLVAMPVCGWIVENCGRNVAFMINGVTYLLSALIILNLRPSPPIEEKGRLQPHPIDDFWSGLRFIGTDRPILFYVVFYGFAQCLVAIFFVCFLSYAVDILGQTVGGTCVLFVTLGFGMGGGALWMGRYSRISGRFEWPFVMMMVAGAGMMLLSKLYTPWQSAIVLFGIGACAVMVMVPMDTFLQRHVPDEFRGRIFAARGALAGIGFLLSLQFSKAVIFHWGVLKTFQMLGAASMLLGMGTLVLGRWAFRKA